MSKYVISILLLLVNCAGADGLSDSTILKARYTGRGASTSKSFQEFATMVRTGDSEQLRALSQGSPAARLYGAIGLYQLNKSEGREVLERLRADKSPVTVMQGCVLQKTTVSEVADNILGGKTDRFSMGSFLVDAGR